jgi:Leucine-rich repeat (LRR) protein
MKFLTLWLIGIALMCCQSMTYGQTSCRTQDSLVLLDLYHATGGGNWTIRTNWLSANPINTWYGIQTDTNGCVTCIDLDGDANCAALAASGVGNHLVGIMPASLGNLARLQRLSLSNNTLSGNIPSSLGNLSNLQWLILHNNQLTGGIPTTLGQLANLQRLWLAYNPLGDTIPTNLGLLSQLRQLWLESNQLTGTIPSVLGQLTDLTYLSLYDNHLVGSIPTLFGNLTQVRTFALGKNQLTGNIPIQLGQLRSAEHLYFENNQLTGNIPTDFQNLTNLTHLSFQFNQIDSIPNLSMLTQLVELEADTNRLTYDDILPNLARNITYRIQDSIFTETIFNKTIGSSFTLHLGIDGAITSNVYNWSKNNVFYRTTTVNQLIINDLTTSDAGAYTCQVTNPNAPNLTLYSRKALLRLLPTYVLDSTVVACQGGFTPIRLTQSIENINGYTIRLQFDSTKVMPDIETNHRLGRMIPAHDSVTLFQYVQNGVLILNLSLQGWQNISGNVGDTLIYLSWKPVLTAATSSLVALTGNVEASNAAGGQTIHPIQANIRTEISSATQFWVLYQGAGAMRQRTPTHPTVVKSGTQGNMTIRGNVSAAGLYFMRPMTGNFVQFQRQSLLSLGMPEIGGHDAFQQNLLIVDHPNAERNISKLIAMDVNGDGLINSGDVSQVLRRAVNFQRGFRQANSIDTMSWRHFPKSYLVSRPEYRISTTFPNDNGTGVSRLRVVKIDTLFRLDSAYYRPCDTSAMDVVAILLGDADGNYATVGTDAKGKLSGTVTLDARNALKMAQDTFKIPIYASETIFGLDVKIENHSDNLKIISINSDVATLETNIDPTTQSAYLSVYATRATGIGMNVPIAYVTVQSKCPKMPDFGKVTSYLNGETAGTEVTSRFCSTESGLKLFPNPVHQVLTIWYGDAQPTTITVFDAIGRKVKIVEPDAEQTILDMSGLVTGIYLVQVDDKTFKIVKQ